ncbi:unnamed protein product [Clonostachys rosea f. rosea IK726]|uniref:Uncharacterized protein n=1 Tax=Clonostachys rosea f. rosea IK726 TaxID=1349383 RepID=A0ACA9TR54_BIOOC|nr:unnamed protein product [Clonostachys rosea f. rosea IK726]
MPPTSDSLGPYPFSLSEHLVVSDQSPSEVNNRTQTSQELLTLENEDDNTQASSRSRRTISLQESHLGAVVYAANSPHSPNSAGLPISVSVEVQGPRKRRLQEHANHPHENVSQVEKRARLSTTSCGDSLHAFESTNHENGSNKSPSSDSLAQIHSQSLPRSLEISQQTIVFWRNLFKRALHQYDETPGNDSPAPSKQPMRLPKPLLRLPSACPYHMWRQIGCTSCFTPNRYLVYSVVTIIFSVITVPFCAAKRAGPVSPDLRDVRRERFLRQTDGNIWRIWRPLRKR